MTQPTTPFAMSDDQPYTASLTMHDSHGGVVTTPPGPVTWSVDDNGALVSFAIAPDGLTAQVAALPAVNAGTFNLAVSTGTLAGRRAVAIVPGAVATADIDLHLTEHASPQAADAVHGNARRQAAAGHHST